MNIGEITSARGAKVFGPLKSNPTHGQFDVQIPLHLVEGAQAGPVLVVQAGVSGLEIEAATVLPALVKEIDPAQMAGTLIVVPLLNTSGFEFEQVNAVWDDKNLNSLGRGKADGTVSEQLIDLYYREMLSKADALLDIHNGAKWGYHCYAGVYRAGAIEKSRQLAVALGLPQVLIGQPDDQSMAQEAARDGKAVVSLWIGGGPGLRDYRLDNVKRTRNAVLNAMRHLGMIGGALEREGGRTAVIDAHTVLKPTGARGLTFMAKEKRGQTIQAGDAIGLVRHPYTGETLQTITAPRPGILLHAGAVWPMIPEGTTLAIVGDLVEEVKD